MSNFLDPKKLDKLQTMSNMVRYNNTVHIHDENVAEHSFYVAFYTMEICEMLHLDEMSSLAAVCRAIYHDVHETEISDIPHNVKLELFGDTNFNDLCVEYENRYNQDNFSKNESRIFYNTINDRNLILAIVDLADVISVRMYARQEVEIGNTKRFGEIVTNSVNRMNDALQRIEKHYKRDNMIYYEQLKKAIEKLED